MNELYDQIQTAIIADQRPHGTRPVLLQILELHGPNRQAQLLRTPPVRDLRQHVPLVQAEVMLTFAEIHSDKVRAAYGGEPRGIIGVAELYGIEADE